MKRKWISLIVALVIPVGLVGEMCIRDRDGGGLMSPESLPGERTAVDMGVPPQFQFVIFQ